MSVFAQAANKAANKTVVADTEKGPSVKLTGTVENGELVIRVPLDYHESDIRLTTPKPGRLALPFVAINVDIGDNIPVTVTGAEGKTIVFTRTNMNMNLFMQWKQGKSKDDE